MPDYIHEGFQALLRKRKPQTLDDEMKEFGKVLGKDFYEDIMLTLDWERLSDGKFNRKKFKTKVLFPFLYGRKPSWKSKSGYKTIMHYFLTKFPAVYCVLWRMRQFTQICQDFYKMTKNNIPYKSIKKHINEIYNPAEFPKDMQRREAEMFFNTIIPQIDQPCVTIHDSVIVQSGKQCNVPEIIKQAFLDKFLIRVRVSSENWY